MILNAIKMSLVSDEHCLPLAGDERLNSIITIRRQEIDVHANSAYKGILANKQTKVFNLVSDGLFR